MFYLDKINKTIPAEPQVRDVCIECNSGVLSQLDSYICQLWDEYFSNIVEQGAEVFFQYNYDLLSRWLIKMCFNSARIHNSDVKHLEKCREYVLGISPHPDNVAIHLQLAKPSNYTPSELQVAKELGLSLTRHEPRLNRVGHFGYKTRTGYGRLVRAVHLQSYLFLIHIFPESVAPSERLSNLDDFKTAMSCAKILHSDKNSCLLECEGLDAKVSLYSHFKRILNNQDTASSALDSSESA